MAETISVPLKPRGGVNGEIVELSPGSMREFRLERRFAPSTPSGEGGPAERGLTPTPGNEQSPVAISQAARA
jgi:hypothetical protein